MDSSARSLGSLGRNDKKGTASLRMTEEGNAARTPGRRDACPTKDRAFERGLWCGRDACPTKDRAFERGLWCRRIGSGLGRSQGTDVSWSWMEIACATRCMSSPDNWPASFINLRLLTVAI